MKKYEYYRSAGMDPENEIEFSGICAISDEIEDYKPDLLLDRDYVTQTLNRVQGRVLTLAEATADGHKLKALKDLIKGLFATEHETLFSGTTSKGTFVEREALAPKPAMKNEKD